MARLLTNSSHLRGDDSLRVVLFLSPLQWAVVVVVGGVPPASERGGRMAARGKAGRRGTAATTTTGINSQLCQDGRLLLRALTMCTSLKTG